MTLTSLSAVPANAQLEHCAAATFYGGNVLRDNWPDVAPKAWLNVPSQGEYLKLLQRSLAPLVIP